MPHQTGDPLLCMTANQVRVYKAYGSVPVWLTGDGALQCTYCNSGNEGCLDSCLLANVMNKMRSDVKFLDAEDARRSIPVTHEEMADKFRRFCEAPDVQMLVSGDRLYADFVDRHKIILVLQGLGLWLKQEADRYAAAGGVHNQSKERLSLKCERAVNLFLRLDLEPLTEEDTIILSNVVETSGYQIFDAAKQNSMQRVLDLISVVNAVKEVQRTNEISLFQQLMDEQEQEKLLTPQVQPPTSAARSTDHQPDALPSPPSSSSHPKPQPPSATLQQAQFPASRPLPLPSSRPAQPQSRTREPAKSSGRLGLDQQTVEIFEDDPVGPNRCRGRTKAGVRCKLTEESVGKLHGRCAEAAEPLARGAKYCKFHRDQEPLF